MQCVHSHEFIGACENSISSGSGSNAAIYLFYSKFRFKLSEFEEILHPDSKLRDKIDHKI